MPSSSRIIAAEELGEVSPFALGSIGSARGDPLRAGAGALGGDEDPLRRAFEQGFRRGAADANARTARARESEQRALGSNLAQRIESLNRSLESEFAQFEQHLADRVIDLAVEIARQVVRGTLATRREAIVPIAQEAIAALTDSRAPATLHLNPADLAVVAEHLAPVLERRQIVLQADPAIAAGGCHLDSPIATVDARLATRWQRTLDALGRPETAPLESAE
jgi:flagellar assembly protein FliH